MLMLLCSTSESLPWIRARCPIGKARPRTSSAAIRWDWRRDSRGWRRRSAGTSTGPSRAGPAYSASSQIVGVRRAACPSRKATGICWRTGNRWSIWWGPSDAALYPRLAACCRSYSWRDWRTRRGSTDTSDRYSPAWLRERLTVDRDKHCLKKCF